MRVGFRPVSVLAAGVVAAASLSLVAQTPGPPQPPPPQGAAPQGAPPQGQPAETAPGGRGGPGRGPLDERAGLLQEGSGPRALSRRRGQEILAAARVQARTGPLRSRHPGARADRLRRQRPDVRPRAARLHAERRRRRRARSGRPDLRARGSRWRRHLRNAQGVRRQPRLPALRHAVWRQRDPHQGIERRRGLEVHRHEQRRRRRQEGALRHRPRPTAQRRAPGERLRLGASTTGSTAPSIAFRGSAGRRRACSASRPASNGGQWGVTQDNYGKMWFQARRQRHARLLPVAGRLRQLQRSRSVRAGSRTSPGARPSSSPTCRAA